MGYSRLLVFLYFLFDASAFRFVFLICKTCFQLRPTILVLLKKVNDLLLYLELNGMANANYEQLCLSHVGPCSCFLIKIII